MFSGQPQKDPSGLNRPLILKCIGFVNLHLLRIYQVSYFDVSWSANWEFIHFGFLSKLFRSLKWSINTVGFMPSSLLFVVSLIILWRFVHFNVSSMPLCFWGKSSSICGIHVICVNVVHLMLELEVLGPVGNICYILLLDKVDTTCKSPSTFLHFAIF